MNRQELFFILKQETGQDFSRNKGVRAFLGSLDSPNNPRIGCSLKALHMAFLPHTDLLTAMAASVICANKYLNGGQIAGFGTYFKYTNGIRHKGIKKSGKIVPGTGNGKRQQILFEFYPAHVQYHELVNSPEQVKKTLSSIKPETLAKYRLVITTIYQLRKGDTQ